jgi:hypothetical protein
MCSLQKPGCHDRTHQAELPILRTADPIRDELEIQHYAVFLDATRCFGCNLVEVETSQSGQFRFQKRKRRAHEPTQSAEPATQAHDQKAWFAPSVDFRSFRTLHSSLMSSIGARPEVTRDNMGHATVDVTQNVYNPTWWEERVDAVSMAAATV